MRNELPTFLEQYTQRCRMLEFCHSYRCGGICLDFLSTTNRHVSQWRHHVQTCGVTISESHTDRENSPIWNSSRVCGQLRRTAHVTVQLELNFTKPSQRQAHGLRETGRRQLTSRGRHRKQQPHRRHRVGTLGFFAVDPHVGRHVTWMKLSRTRSRQSSPPTQTICGKHSCQAAHVA